MWDHHQKVPAAEFVPFCVFSVVFLEASADDAHMKHTKDPEIDEQVRVFGENMRNARLAAGLSQVELSEASRLDRAAIGFLERAERAPDLSTLLRVARALELSPTALLDGFE
jgi:ribosome-binding protein aMBF1 (putative translation factor)